MTNTKMLGQDAQVWWRYLQKPIAAILVVTALTAGVFDWHIVQAAAFPAAALIVLALVFEMHAAMVPAPPPFFKDYHDAYADFKKRVERLSARGNDLDIGWLGLAMQHGAIDLPVLWNSLSHDHSSTRVTLAMLDPDWSGLEELNTTWPNLSRTSRDALLKFLQEQSKASRSFRGALYTYSHPPNIHGFSMNNRYYYITMCKWEKDQMVVVTGYEFLESGRDAAADAKIALFCSWFDYCRRKGPLWAK